nr:MAG TPA_asm: Membrane protein [Caudoviricetes sp.]
MRNPIVGKVVSGYSNNRFHPYLKVWQSHAGIDIAAPQGTPIRAAFAGKVIKAGRNCVPGRTGNGIAIQNPDSEVQYYGHLRDGGTFVKVGQQVAEGQIIGECGSTGNSTGPHLHFSCWRNGNHTSHADPRAWFEKYGITPGVDNPPKTTTPAKPAPTAPKPAAGKEWPAVALVVDGVFGPVTKKAYQRLLKGINCYAGNIDGQFGPLSIKGEQKWLKSKKRYSGAIDGVRGPLTIKALQKHLQVNGTYPKSSVIGGTFGPGTCTALQKFINSQARYF